MFWGAQPPDDEADGIFVQLAEDPTDLIIDSHPVLTGLEGGVWQRLADPPAFAYQPALAGQGNYCYVVGGMYREAAYKGAVQRYNTQTKVWDRLADIPGTADILGAKAFVIGDKLFCTLAISSARIAPTSPPVLSARACAAASMACASVCASVTSPLASSWPSSLP